MGYGPTLSVSQRHKLKSSREEKILCVCTLEGGNGGGNGCCRCVSGSNKVPVKPLHLVSVTTETSVGTTRLCSDQK